MYIINKDSLLSSVPVVIWRARDAGHDFGDIMAQELSEDETLTLMIGSD